MAQTGQRRNSSRHSSSRPEAVAQFGKLLYRRLAVGQVIAGGIQWPSSFYFLHSPGPKSPRPAFCTLHFELCTSQRPPLTPKKQSKQSKVIKLPQQAHTLDKLRVIWLSEQ